MQITILAVGKNHSAEVAPLIAEYEKRLGKEYQVAWQFMPQHADAATARQKESELILQKIQPSDTVILLDERGKQQTNEVFARTFENLAGQHGSLVIVIGGAFGVNDEVRNRAQFTWSFSTLVFPHMLMRVLLLEQLYRTAMVIKGHPYHHA